MNYWSYIQFCFTFLCRWKSNKKSSFKKSRKQFEQDTDSFSRPLPNISKKKLHKLDEHSDSENEYSYLSKRPEPIGEVVEAQRLDDFETLPASGLPSKLPPLEAKAPKKSRKKKKKVLKKLSHVDSDGEIWRMGIYYLSCSRGNFKDGDTFSLLRGKSNSSASG